MPSTKIIADKLVPTITVGENTRENSARLAFLMNLMGAMDVEVSMEMVQEAVYGIALPDLQLVVADALGRGNFELPEGVDKLKDEIEKASPKKEDDDVGF